MKSNSIIYTILILLIVYASKKTNSDVKLNVQTQRAGDITVAVLPIRTGTEFVFEFQLDTHTTEITYQLEYIAVLTNETGETLKPIKWEGDPPGGHNRSGTLTFPPFKTAPKSIFLNIENLENRDVKFNWNLI